MKMFKSAGFGALLIASCSIAFSQVPPAAPSGSTGLCRDGTYTNTDSKKGACGGHKGVKEWFGTGPASRSMAAASTARETPATQATTKGSTEATAPGGGAGQVWVNTATKVYHCQGTRYYGKTKKGEYMTEAAAKAAGDRPDHGKSCT